MLITVNKEQYITLSIKCAFVCFIMQFVKRCEFEMKCDVQRTAGALMLVIRNFFAFVFLWLFCTAC
jgi:hypothetical protein